MSETSPKIFSGKLANIVGYIVLIAVLALMSLRTGAAFIIRGFSSADTCWLVKLGQYIAAAGVPKQDPFSFTLKMYADSGTPEPYIVYQWLAEFLFFKMYSLRLPGLGDNGFDMLAACCAIITSITFLSITLRCCIRANAPVWWTAIAVGFASLADNVRCVIRPELFSCLWLTALLALLQTLRRNYNQISSIQWKYIAAFAAIFVVWANQHSGFVAGLVTLVLYALAFVVQDIRTKRSVGAPSKTILIGTLVAGLATLATPYNLRLWAYLPHLFFSPVNKQIAELRPLDASALMDPYFIPFVFVLTLTYCTILFQLIHVARKRRELLSEPLYLASIVIVIVATVVAFATRRMVSLTALVCVIETANMLGFTATKIRWSPIWQSWRADVAIVMLVVSLTLVGTFETRKFVPFAVPSPTAEFLPPFAAMNVFLKKYDGGRIFAHPQIGDLLDLYLSPANSIYMDTRFDAFPEKVFQNYYAVTTCQPGSSTLLESYQVKWVWSAPGQPLDDYLRDNPRWETVYGDKLATIYKRSQATLQQ